MNDKTEQPDPKEDTDPGFWYKPTRAGLTIATDHRTLPHPRAGQTKPVRPPAGELVIARPGNAIPEGWIHINRESAQGEFGEDFVTALLPRPDSAQRPQHERKLIAKASKLLEAFIEGCREESQENYWTPREEDKSPEMHKQTRIALAIRPDACAHPIIAPRPSAVRIVDKETGTSVEVEALGEIPARVHARTGSQAPWRLIDYHHDDLNAAIAQVVDPSYGHRTLPAKIEVLEAMAAFIYNDEQPDAKGEATVAANDVSTDITTTVDAKGAIRLLAMTIHLAREPYGRPGWTVDAVDRYGGRILIRAPANETLTETTAASWYDKPNEPAPTPAAIQTHQKMRRKVQTLISKVMNRGIPLWAGEAYQERITEFRALENADPTQSPQP